VAPLPSDPSLDTAPIEICRQVGTEAKEYGAIQGSMIGSLLNGPATATAGGLYSKKELHFKPYHSPNEQ